MKKRTFTSLAALAIALAPAALSARPMTADDLVSLRRIAMPTVSPDGRWVAYQLRETDLAANKGRTDLWLLDLSRKGASPVRIGSVADKNEHDPSFSADGKSLYFLSDASGSDQLWRVPLAGGAAEQVTSLATDVAGYRFSPEGSRLAIWADRDLACTDFNCTGLPEAKKTGTGRVYDESFVRHWDTWAEPGVRSRLFVFPVQVGKAVGNGVPVST